MVSFLFALLGMAKNGRVLTCKRHWNIARNCRSANRNANEPRNKNLGFRLVAARLSQAAMADPILEAPGSRPVRVVPRRVLVRARMRARTLLPGFLILISAGSISP